MCRNILVIGDGRSSYHVTKEKATELVKRGQAVWQKIDRRIKWISGKRSRPQMRHCSAALGFDQTGVAIQNIFDSGQSEYVSGMDTVTIGETGDQAKARLGRNEKLTIISVVQGDCVKEMVKTIRDQRLRVPSKSVRPAADPNPYCSGAAEKKAKLADEREKGEKAKLDDAGEAYHKFRGRLPKPRGIAGDAMHKSVWVPCQLGNSSGGVL